MPLNLLELHRINYLFPDARILFIARHPLDAILSNWQQFFELNPAMSNMLDLDQIVKFYNVCMETFELSVNALQLKVHTLRYEDLLVNFEPVMQDVLQFLEVEWDSNILNYQNTASKRTRIKTTSYAQVIKPIYTSSSNKWINYAEQLKHYLPQIDRWLLKFGYAE